MKAPYSGASIRSWPYLWATRRPSSGLRWAGVVIASADRRLGYAGVLAGPAAIGFIAHSTSLLASFALLAVLLFVQLLIGLHVFRKVA